MRYVGQHSARRWMVLRFLVEQRGNRARGFIPLIYTLKHPRICAERSDQFVGEKVQIHNHRGVEAAPLVLP